MSNVNPNHYKVAGRDRQGEAILQEQYRQKFADSRARDRFESRKASPFPAAPPPQDAVTEGSTPQAPETAPAPAPKPRKRAAARSRSAKSVKKAVATSTRKVTKKPRAAAATRAKKRPAARVTKTAKKRATRATAKKAVGRAPAKARRSR